MTPSATLPILLLTGYLGSGKTTLVNHILNNRKGIRFAVIVNDIGEINIDAGLIQRGGIVDMADDSLVSLQNGCICCTLQTDLMDQIDSIIKMDRFDYLVIEASGICEPAPIAQTITMMPRVDEKYIHSVMPRIDCICTVVDALRMVDEFGGGTSLRRDDIDEDDIENLVIQQIEFCNIVLLNKISEVTRQQADTLREIIHTLQPTAEIIECDYADVDLDSLLNTRLFDINRLATAATWVQQLNRPVDELDEEEHHHHHDDGHHHEDHHHGHHHHHHHGEGEAEEYGIGSFVYYRRRPIDLNRFDRMVATAWPRSVIRCKGVCYFGQNPDMSYLFETAGRQVKLTEAGQWYATAPADELDQILANEPGLRRDWDDEYGDRMQKLVFIGREMDRADIETLLDACLM